MAKSKDNIIEQEFQNLVKKYDFHRNKKTGNEAVLQYLKENTTKNKHFFFAWEVIGKKTKTGDWLSHRACARLTDLVDLGYLESRRIGKFCVYALLPDLKNK
jgi:hypothetical protein